MLASAKCELVTGQAAPARLSGCRPAAIVHHDCCCNVHRIVPAIGRWRGRELLRGSEGLWAWKAGLKDAHQALAGLVRTAGTGVLQIVMAMAEMAQGPSE